MIAFACLMLAMALAAWAGHRMDRALPQYSDTPYRRERGDVVERLAQTSLLDAVTREYLRDPNADTLDYIARVDGMSAELVDATNEALGWHDDRPGGYRLLKDAGRNLDTELWGL